MIKKEFMVRDPIETFYLQISNRPTWTAKLTECLNYGIYSDLKIIIKRENDTVFAYTKHWWRDNETECQNFRSRIMSADKDQPITLLINSKGFDIEGFN